MAKRSTTHSLKEKQLTYKDKKEVEELLAIYLEEEPVTKHFNLTKEDKQAFIDVYVKNCLGSNGAAMGFIDPDRGELVGCNLVLLPSAELNMSDYVKTGKSLSTNLLNMIRFDSYLESFAYNIDGSDNAIWLEIGVMKKGYRGRNLFVNVKKWLLQLAQNHKCDVIFDVTINELSYRSVSKSGFIPIKTIHYKDYRDPVTGEATYADVPLPHTKATLFMLKIAGNSKL